VLAVWAADCAGRTLFLFEAQAPSDMRPRGMCSGDCPPTRPAGMLGALTSDMHTRLTGSE